MKKRMASAAWRRRNGQWRRRNNDIGNRELKMKINGVMAIMAGENGKLEKRLSGINGNQWRKYPENIERKQYESGKRSSRRQ
jgi:hypothetical protein